MAEENVHKLEVVSPLQRQVPQVIELLESLLARAKEGKIYCLVVACETPDTYTTEWAGLGDTAKRVGMAQMAVLNAAGIAARNG